MAKLVTLVALGVFLLAGNAQAATLTPTGASGPGGTVFGTAPGDPTFSNFAGLLGAKVEGEAAWVYCIDIENRTLLLQPYAEATWAAAGVPNLAKVARILAQHPADATASSGNNVEAAAVQSAIWHFTDGFQLTGGSPGVVALYNEIVADANANAGSEPPATPTLTLNPDSQTGAAGAYLQFTVSTTAAGPVNLSVTPSGDANLVTCDAAHTPIGGSLAGPFPKQVCLHRTTAGGPVTLAASVSATVPAARVFLLTGSQKLILGSPKTVTASDT